MTKDELLGRGLPKWPALLVVGENVTEDQAKLILIRTDSFSFSCNDQEWERDLNEAVYGIHAARHEYKDTKDLDQLICERHKISEKDWSALDEAKGSYTSKYGLLEGIYYLNNQRISSSWIGGPHGWCNWDGKIGSTNYNIGKYPSCNDVYEEWKIIAEAFPFLNLRSQLLNCEAGEEDTVPEAVIEFVISGGKVQVVEPKSMIAEAAFGSDGLSDGLLNFSNPHRERGCTIETFRSALKATEIVIEAEKALSEGRFWEGQDNNKN
jgi:hypothetical protein